MTLFVRIESAFSLRKMKVKAVCFSTNKSAARVVAVAWMKIVFVTRISGNKSILFLSIFHKKSQFLSLNKLKRHCVLTLADS